MRIRAKKFSAGAERLKSAPISTKRLRSANGTDYALTGGFFSRSPDNIERVKARPRGGNVYINRSCTGAIVGRHPFWPDSK